MLFFLRQVRRKLMHESKISTYLLYAVGEIFLVVVGILIAISIDNWNEQKKERQKEITFLQALDNDLRQNFDAMQHELEGRTKYTHQSLNTIINHLNDGRPYDKKIAIDFARAIGGYGSIEIKTSGYESLTSSGLDIIKDAELRSEISLHFNQKIQSVKDRMNEIRDDFYSYVLDYSRRDFQMVNDSISPLGYILLPNDYEELLEDKVFLQSLKVYATVSEDLIDTIQKLTDHNAHLQKMIEKEINRN